MKVEISEGNWPREVKKGKEKRSEGKESEERGNQLSGQRGG